MARVLIAAPAGLFSLWMCLALWRSGRGGFAWIFCLTALSLFMLFQDGLGRLSAAHFCQKHKELLENCERLSAADWAEKLRISEATAQRRQRALRRLGLPPFDDSKPTENREKTGGLK